MTTQSFEAEIKRALNFPVPYPLNIHCQPVNHVDSSCIKEILCLCVMMFTCSEMLPSRKTSTMGLCHIRKPAVCACAKNGGNIFPPVRVSDPGMYYGTCLAPIWHEAHLAVSFEVGGGDNVPGISGACTTRKFTYLVRGPWRWKCWTLSHTLASIREHICGMLNVYKFFQVLCQ